MPCEGAGDFQIAFFCNQEDSPPGSKENVSVTLKDVLLYVVGLTDILRVMIMKVTNSKQEIATCSLFGGPLKVPICRKLYSLRGCPIAKDMLQKGTSTITRNSVRMLIRFVLNRKAVLASRKYGPKDFKWKVLRTNRHASSSRLKYTARAMDVKLPSTFRPCQECFISKGLGARIPKSTSCRYKETLGRVFVYLSGKEQVISPGYKQHAML